MKQYVWNQLSAREQAALLERPALREDAALQARVAEIIARVRADGDRAVFELTEEIDGVRLDTLKATPEEFDAAETALDEDQKNAIATAQTNIRRFHEAQLTGPIAVETAPGVLCERLTRPITNVGLYVPAGSAPLPSTALMLAVPAAIAGCSTRVLCSPPQADGRINSAVLYVARLCGLEDVYKIGGAQAIAAMAYGTASVPKVDKLFGPGNTWVTAAKTQAAQDPSGAAKDMPAGPSEVLVIADESADPQFVAADLLSQAEHGPDSQSVLISTSAALAAAALEAVTAQQARLSRREIIAESLAHSFALVVDDLETAIDVSNRYAPEHLILQIENARTWVERIQAAGSVFLGPWTPESVGDYCSGTNHVLPTYGFARSYSSLGVNDFLRSMTIQELSASGIEAIGPTACTLADMEGLDAHAHAVTLRLEKARGTAQ
ncbi:MAG: histidinol dehydrogenase [Gammaproteobacteria bacterium]|nr:histidinol dehydrogenase [Gammaproteobacteria bacterium]MDH3506071.1 histidinol dehydrogenase [Gammaproteobacteria bacterium]